MNMNAKNIVLWVVLLVLGFVIGSYWTNANNSAAKQSSGPSGESVGLAKEMLKKTPEDAAKQLGKLPEEKAVGAVTAMAKENPDGAAARLLALSKENPIELRNSKENPIELAARLYVGAMSTLENPIELRTALVNLLAPEDFAGVIKPFYKAVLAEDSVMASDLRAGVSALLPSGLQEAQWE